MPNFYDAPLDPAEVAGKLRAGIARMQLFLATAETIRDALAPFGGKVVTKRLETAVKAQLPGFSTYYENKFGMYYLTVWRGGPRNQAMDYNDRMQVLLAYDGRDGGKYNHAAQIACGGGLAAYLRYAQEIPRWEALLPAVPESVIRFNAARLAYLAAVADFEPAAWRVFGKES